ncbi:MAG TPA: endonuclease [Ferruginibacter sp.]|nr:endonuclease [Ferruginibacter sp.]HMP20397.1 endonuclease [Ferruginibacter sp.]
MLKYLYLSVLICAFSFSYGQVSITATGTGNAYTENFNSLAATGTANSSMPAGWAFSEAGANANSTYAADAGGSNAGNTYSYGTNPSTERALGCLRSGNLWSVFGVHFINNTGAPITSIAVTYRGELWRLGALNRQDTLNFQYSLSATTLTDGTWIDEDALDFSTPAVTGSTGGKDGNAAVNNQTITYTINGIFVPEGGSLWLRWVDADITGAEDGLAVDDVQIVFSGSTLDICSAPTAQPTGLVLTPGSRTITGSFNAAIPPADEYLVVRSTSATLSQTPVNTTTYTPGQALGNGVVVSFSSSSTFTDEGLNPLTQYYYFIFSAHTENCIGGPVYFTTAPLSASATTLALPVCTIPASGATSLVLTPSNKSISGQFTGTASANRYLVVMSTSATLGVTPVNGTTYTIGQALGSGIVVAYGNSVQFIATGLTTATPYYFFVFAANGDCNGEPFYNTAALTGVVSTTNSTTGVPPGYYDAANNLTCAALKTALKDIITANSIQLNYNPDTWNAFTTTDLHRNDANTADVIWDIYSDNPNGPEAYYFDFGTQQCGNYAKEGDCYNREHSFPQEWFGSKQYPMYSDLHHVFPTDGWVNGLHASNPYGEVSNPIVTTSNGSKSGLNTYGCYSGIVFEPIDAYKGDVARAQLYIITRYEDSMIKWRSNGDADKVLNGTLYPSLDDWYIQLLLKWNKIDPVSQKEIDRNNAIYALQNNRNPFVDNPDYADSIFKCVNLQCVVPVVLTSFSAKLQHKTVELQWQVNREINFSRYEVQQSTDGRNFYTIGTVRGLQQQNYSFTDNHTGASSIYFYRLKMVDIDGQFAYSKVATVRLHTNNTDIILYPNPATNTVFIELKNGFTQSGTLQVIDVAGRTMLQQNINAGQNKIQADVHRLPAGRYFAVIRSSNSTVHQPLVLVK